MVNDAISSIEFVLMLILVAVAIYASVKGIQSLELVTGVAVFSLFIRDSTILAMVFPVILLMVLVITAAKGDKSIGLYCIGGWLLAVVIDWIVIWIATEMYWDLLVRGV